MTLTRAARPDRRPSSTDLDARAGVQVDRLLAGVRHLVHHDTIDHDACRDLYADLGAVPVQVAAAADCGLSDEQAAEAVDTAALAGELQRVLRRHVRTTTSTRFGQVQCELSRLGRLDEPAALAAAAAAAVCAAGGFDRAMLSRVDGSSWFAGSVHVAAAGPCLEERPVRGGLTLTAGRPETEAVRRRVPVLAPATGGAQDHPLPGAGTCAPYLVAPLAVEGRVVGLLHADNAPSGRLLTRLDRDALQLFADGFGRAYERVALLERLARQREHVRALLAPDGVDTEPDRPVVRLARSCPAPADGGGLSVLRSASELPQTGRLTSREHEILRQLATGATNAAIAEQLFLSESTVKSHVKRILRKLPAANRAEAVYVYLQIAGAEGRPA